MENAKSNITIKSEFLELLSGSIDKKVNLSLAIFLFTEKKVSLARAAELAEVGIGDFVDVLKSHNIFWSEYTDDLEQQDNSTLEYILEEKNNND